MTGLDFQTVDVKFTQGLDTRTQRKLVMPGKWDELINVTLADDGTPQRRDGLAALVASASGNGLATYNKELLVVNGATVSSVSTAGADIANAVSGKLGYVGVSKAEVRRSTGVQDSMDCANGGGFTCYVWRALDGNSTVLGINCSLVDETTGAQLIVDSALIAAAGAICPRVVFADSAFFIFYISGTSLRCRVIRISAPTTVGAEVSLVTSVSLSTRNFDAIAFGASSAMVSYGWADGVTSVRTIQAIHTLGVPSVAAGPVNLFTEAQVPILTLSALTCAAFDATLAATIVLNSAGGAFTGTSAATINAAWAVVTAANNILGNPPAVAGNTCHITATPIGGRLQVFSDEQSSWNTPALSAITSIIINTGLTVFSGPGTIVNSATFASGGGIQGPKGPFIHGKAFTSGTSVYLPMCVMENYSLTAVATNNQQNVFLLFDCTGAAAAVGAIAAAVVARALYGTFGIQTIAGSAPQVSTPCSSPEVSSGSFAVACPERTTLSFSNGINISPTGVVRLTLTPNTTRPPIRTQLGETTYLAGGSLTGYDGAAIAEHGFPLFPEGIGVVASAGAGVTAGVHQVIAVYEWIDNAGQRHQSAPSLPSSGTAGGGTSQLTVVVPTLLISQKVGVNIVLFMTQAGGLTFYRVTPVNVPVPNTTAATSVTIVISSSDATIAGNELLYTQPNQAGTTLPNLAPPPCSVLGVHQNRVWFDRADQPVAFGYSQQYINNVGLQFNEQLGGVVDVSAGAFTGFASLDEKQIIFCARKLYVVYGTGPTANGGFSNYSDPQEIPADVGCSEPRSIVKMPNGIIFKSAKGFYLLGRDLSVRYIGDGVARYDADTITSAVILEDRHECRFTTTGSAQLRSQLIYDYLADQWSTTQISFNNGAANLLYAPADALWWSTGGYYASVGIGFGLNRDTPGVFLDAAGGTPVAIPTQARTAFLHVGVLAGLQRVRRLFLTGTSPNAPTSSLTISVDFDDAYNAVAPGSYSFTTVLSTITFALGMPIDLRHKLRRQKCKSIAFTFTDVPTVANPSGVNFQALSLEVGMKRGLSKLPAAQSIG